MCGTTGNTVFANRRAVKTTHCIMAQFLSSLEGEEWKRVRRIVAQTFTTRKLKSIFPIMQSASAKVMDVLDRAANRSTRCQTRNDSEGEVLEEKDSASESDVNLKDLFGNYTMDVIAQSAFATQPTKGFVAQASALFTFPYWRKFLDYVMPAAFLDWVGFTVLPKEPMDFFREHTQALINERTSNDTGGNNGSGDCDNKENNSAQSDSCDIGGAAARPEKPNDFLQLLLDAEDDGAVESDPSASSNNNNNNNNNHNDSNNSSSSSSKNLSSSNSSKAKLSHEEILAQSVLFFSVGYETSSQVLMYATFCLAHHPECQDRLVGQLNDARLDSTGDWDYDALIKLPYLDAVVNESLRLYNPVLRMERRASEDFVLGDTGIVVPKGMIVGIPVWALHHSEKYFPEPMAFKPERFLPENRADIVDSTFLPFGQGPRDCVGKRFAMLETKLLLAEMLTRFRFVPTARTVAPLKFDPTGRPLLGPRPVFVAVEPR